MDSARRAPYAVTPPDGPAAAGRTRGADSPAPEGDELARLRRENAQLRGQVEELAAFSATVAHDLKGPLASLTGFVHLATRPGTPDDVRDVVLARAVGVGHRMDQLIDGLLGYARAGGAHDLPEPHDLRGPVDLALESLDHEVRERDALVDVADLDHAVVDHDRLVQVVQNLVANALVHGVRDGARPVVRIATRRVDDEVELFVEDRGPGIAPEHRESVLLPLVRGEGALAPGTGLGLATSRRLTEAMGGRLVIGDADHGGARISLHLPAAPRPAQDRTASPRSGVLPLPAHADRRPRPRPRARAVAAEL